jgi:HlyD family secretion protein
MAQSALGRFDKTTPDGEEVEQFEVTSPTTGRVLKVFQQSEGVVGAGSQLLEIGDPTALEVAVDVLTSDAVHIAPGAHVSIEQWGGVPLEGAVRLVEPSAFTRTSALGVEEQRVNAIIEINAPYERWRLLGDGYRVEARIETYRSKDALQIPWSALFHREDYWGVFVIEAETAKTKKVTVGRRNETQAEVLEGLTAGQKVIVHPGDKVADGTKVASSKAGER